MEGCGVTDGSGTVADRDEAAVQRAAETSVLGSVLRNRALMADLGDVAPEHFVDPVNREAWRQMLGDAGIEDDLGLQLAVPGMDATRAAAIAAANHQRSTVQRAKAILLESRARRDLRRVLVDAMTAVDARGASAAEIGARARRSLDDVSASSTTSVPAVEVARMLERQEQSGHVPTGLRALDYVLYGGLHYGLLTGIFARYKVGKTVLMATIARNLEGAGVPALMVSLERRNGDVERFVVARALGVDARDLDLRDNPEHRQGFAEYLESERTLRYIHRPGIAIDELRAIIVAEIQAHGVKVVLVDYWQLITNPTSRSSQADKQQDAAQMLADLAATPELGDVAIVVTGQLNQEGHPRGGEGILAAAGIVVKIEREINAEGAFIKAMVSNKGPELAKGSPDEPSIALIQPGPHFADHEDRG